MFKELKKLYRASALARWIATKGVLVDLDKVRGYSANQFVDAKNYQNKVRAIANRKKEDLGIVETKVKVDARTVAIRSLKAAGMDTTEEKIKKAIE